jgi:methylenetetrahydrofolate reductase (NADPH)
MLAFGSNDTYGLTLHTPPEIGLRIWKRPTSPADISTLFTRYVKGDLPAIPWSEDPLAPETVTIQKYLIALNESGRWTVGSQPAVNSIASGDEIFGWGPKGGYIFQKVPHLVCPLTTGVRGVLHQRKELAGHLY